MKIGIMGFGHLGQAFTKGLLNKQFVLQQDIYVTTKSEESLHNARMLYKVNTCDDNIELIEKVDIVIIALPKIAFFEYFSSKNIIIDNNKIYISLMAGVKTETIKELLGDVSLVRAMPNLGIADNDGVIGYTKTDDQFIIDMMNHLGHAFMIDENEIEKVTAFASCGVGFAAYILDSFYRVGKSFGFDDITTRKIIANIFTTALTTEDYEKLVTAVATKGGATEAGVNNFNDNRLNDVIRNGINEAFLKMTKSDE
ncbi:MAG: NAD(P)-binding domain-containing protein [Erysipelotrichaceae bacterium]|nr:NAD(P)-binding domain-containing protein [Erysipelotrichaceae bacterium]